MHALQPELVEEVEVVKGEIRDVLDPVGGGRAAVAGMARAACTAKRAASRSWKGSQRPAPPAPCRNSSGGPLPLLSSWTGVPRTSSTLCVMSL